MNDFNTSIVEEFRANKGVVGGMFAGRHLLILHAAGRRSGTERLYPLVYVTDGDSYVVCGSKGGAPTDPVWVLNVGAMTDTTIEVGADTIRVKPTVLREGAERDRLYELIVDYAPQFRESYERRTDRVFPIVRLDPVG